MTVPAHNLYDFVHQATERRFWLLYFSPWGSKHLDHVLDYQKDYDHANGPNGVDKILGEQLFDHKHTTISQYSLARNFQPILFCHDQEPLAFDLYRDDQPFMAGMQKFNKENYDFPVHDQNLRNTIVWSWQRRWILLHSEINSPELVRYESTGRYRGAYWWSHALIALDWFRFAEHDQRLDYRNSKKMFLIYCRDTTGSRQYRSRVIESLTDCNQCDFGAPTDTTGATSASYDPVDFCNTDISVVLETMFADPRIHLTEKTLRPIACGHPFILAAGPGSLALLKRYGFETFHPYIDESYDSEPDHDRRLGMIINEIRRLSDLPVTEKKSLIAACRDIAEKNKKLFFSQTFFQSIKEELIANVMTAHHANNNLLDPGHWWQVRQWRKRNLQQPERPNPLSLRLVRHLRLHQGSFEKYQRHEHCLDYKSSTHGDDV